MTLGSRLVSLRDKKGLSQVDAAKKIGISNVQLNRYEKDERKPDPDGLVKLADFYNVSTDYLLGRTSVPNCIKSQEPSAEELERMQIAAHMEHEYGEIDPEFTKFIQKIIGQVREEYDLVKKKEKDAD